MSVEILGNLTHRSGELLTAADQAANSVSGHMGLVEYTGVMAVGALAGGVVARRLSENRSKELGGEYNDELNADTVKGALVGAMVLGNVSILVQVIIDISS